MAARLLPLVLFALAHPLAAAEPVSTISFREVSSAWGLDFRHHHGGAGERYMIETVVGGVVLFDYDGDGDVDVFFVDGGPLPGYEGETPASRLYRNDGGRFVDVTEACGIVVEGYGAGAVAGDVDGDGDLDLYVTVWGENQLFENRGDGTFLDVTERSGAGDPAWSVSAALADADGDGDLDLYVGNYVDWSLTNHKFCGDQAENVRGYCSPSKFHGLPDTYYENRGDGTFVDATQRAGFSALDPSATLGLAWGDLDDDGLLDLYVAIDSEPNALFRNRGDGTFEEIALLAGVAYSDRGRPEAGMGVDFGDYDGDGRLDVVVTNFELETHALYQNLGSNVFFDARYTAGVAEPSLLYLTFGVAFGDLDQDGDLDLALGNGHILDNAEFFGEHSHYAQPNQVLENLGNGRFAEASGAGLDVVRVSRGLAMGDLDGDGDLEIVINDSNDLAEVWENVGAAGGWLGVEVRSPSGNRLGIGARVTVETPLGKQLREVRTSSSYLSQSAHTLHFGLGGAERVDRLTVRWPGGRRLTLGAVPTGRRLMLTGPSGKTKKADF